MEPSSERALEQVAEAIASACDLLRAAERIVSDELGDSLGSEGNPDLLRLEEVLHIATHEAGSHLGFLLNDMAILRLRINVRREFSMLRQAEFEEVVSQSWSLALVVRLHHQIAQRQPMTLAQASEIIKQAQAKWSRLPPYKAREE